MAKVLLLNSPILGANNDPNSDTGVPPLGIGYIHTQLLSSGHKSRFIDAVLKNLRPEQVVEIVNTSDADYVGLNIFSSNVEIVRSIVENVQPTKTLLLGGPAIRYLIPEIKTWAAQCPVIVVIGDAELALPIIINANDKAGLKTNFICIDATGGSPYFPQNIDLPLDRTIFKNEPVVRTDLGLIESHVIASRGCVYNCAFCASARSQNWSSRPRIRSYESLDREVRGIKARNPQVNSIRLLDDLFLASPANIDFAIRLFSETDLYWRSMAHVNTFRDLSSEYLSRIKYSGCKELFFGVESGSNVTLKHMGKAFTTETAFRTISNVLDSQLAVKCYFIMGYPGETEARAEETLSFATRLRKYALKVGSQFRISPFRFRPYHGTSIYNELIAAGIPISHISNRSDVDETQSVNPYDCTSGLFAAYSEATLGRFMTEMERLNEYT
jgi:radical SAM superfamily enzyme YgiQ (UPF0313 family)